VVKEFILSKLDTYFKVQCSNDKNGNYTFKKLEDALEYPFIRFGNQYFIPSISIDIDTTSDYELVIARNGLPEPTLVVKTTKGVHIHWFLQHRIKTSNRAQVTKLNIIIKHLQGLFGADTHATTGSSGRIWRNPLKHPSIFSGKVCSFSEFIIPEKEKNQNESIKLVGKTKYKKTLSMDFTKIAEGSRNSELFNYGSAYAYTTGVTNVLDELTRKNSLLTNPLSLLEVKRIASSIEVFMTTKYRKGNYQTSERTIEFNRKVAKNQADKKFVELLNKSLSLFITPVYNISIVSIRKGAEKLKTSKDSFSKYKIKLISKIKEILSANCDTIKAWFKFIEANMYVPLPLIGSRNSNILVINTG